MAGVGAPIRVLRAPAESVPLHGALYAVHLTLVTVAFVVLFVVWVPIGLTWAAAAGFLFALGDTLQNYAQAHLTSLNEQRAANFLVLVHRLVPLGVAVWAYVVTGAVAMSALSAAFAVPVILGVSFPLRSALAAGVRPLHRVFSGWLGYWAYACSATANQFQLPLLSAVAGSTLVGLFSMSSKVVGPITLLTTSIAAVIVPELARRTSTPPAFASLYRKLLAVCFGYFALVLMLAYPASMVIIALAGSQYNAARYLVIASIVGAGISACSQGFNAKLLAVGAPGNATWAMVIGAAVGLLMILAMGLTESEWMLCLVPVVSQGVVLSVMVYAARSVSVDPVRARRVADS
ncbi:hypothetical protein [Gordonia sp. ABSL49_1]|uniref:hypothetical protein n=1 Tax=Gordonia sp. ABSL49_1 TaxID=2920941 RepID=UPI001F0EEE38|nr:hypothetical protein [Gordonia sp. ABSL49_1]MCH5645481.1 hypothetical protein [Gordonia sp. ABSL49_1]